MKKRKSKKALSWAVVLAGIGGSYFLLSNIEREVPVITNVIVPDFTAEAAKGEAVFQGTCAACHGVNLEGTPSGPPLVYRSYGPSFHSDFAITSAINNGVVPHHWRFGPMPAQYGIAKENVDLVIAYIREMQRANGIE